MKKLITIICIGISTIIYSQNVTVSIENVTVNGVSQSNTATIEMGTSSSVNVTFRVDLSKLESYSIGPGKVWISVFNSSGGRTDYYITDVSESEFITGASNNYDIPIHASEIDFGNGNYLSALLKQNNSPGAEWESQHIPINKTPTFELLPTSINLPCNDTSPRIFAVSNPSSINGTLSYQWSVGSSWEYQGNAVSNFTTTTNSIQLTPTQYPLSDVKVTPVLDGVSYPQLTSTINLSNFSLGSQRIIGASTVCSSRDYILNGLPSDTTITWSVSDTSIATVTPINGSQTTVTATGDGVITLIALVTNSCNQTVELTKTNINIGSPSFASGSMTGESEPFTGAFEPYTVPVASGAPNYDWYFDVGGVLGTSIDGWEIILDQNTNFVNITVGSPGLAVLVCKVSNSCGTTTKYKYITALSTSGGGGGTDPCLTSLKFSSNPMKSGVSTNKVIIIDDPCLNPSMKSTDVTTTNHTITIFNRFSSKIYYKTQTEKEFNINNLQKGLYIVKYENTKGRSITKNLIIN